MSGGGKKSAGSSMGQTPYAPATAPTFAPNTEMPVGYQLPVDPSTIGTLQTGIGTGAPGWAQGAWGMPWWGQQAPETGMAMLQANQTGPYAPAAAPGPAAPAAQDPASGQFAEMVKAGYSPEQAQIIMGMGGRGSYGLLPGQNLNGSMMQLGQPGSVESHNYAWGYAPQQFWGQAAPANLGWT